MSFGANELRDDWLEAHGLPECTYRFACWFGRDIRVLLIASMQCAWLKNLVFSRTFRKFYVASLGVPEYPSTHHVFPEILKLAAMAGLRQDWEEYEKIIAILDLQDSF